MGKAVRPCALDAYRVVRRARAALAPRAARAAPPTRRPPMSSVETATWSVRRATVGARRRAVGAAVWKGREMPNPKRCVYSVEYLDGTSK